MASAAVQTVPQSGSTVPNTLLGHQTAGLHTSGKIRPGIKVLNKAAEKNERARAIYEDGMRKGLAFDEIERAITDAIPDLKNPLAMRNTPYFVVRRDDVANPAIAEQIMTLYAEDRGDGVKRLYRFPVIFPADQWQLVVPHSLRTYTAGGLKYWSQYSDDGTERYCMTYAKPRTNRDGRVIRIFGGRKHVRREENGGRCDPENCAEYQSRQCNMDGRIIFWIPGVETLNPLELPTRSFYGLTGVIEILKRVGFARGGRISGFLNAQRQTFWISKSFESVPHIDEHGKAVRVDQWIIRLDAPVDVARLLRGRDEDALVVEAERSAQVLTVGEVAPFGAGTPASANEVREQVQGEIVDADPADSRPSSTAPRAATAPSAQTTAAAAAPKSAAAVPAAPTALADLHALLTEMAVEVALFERYAAKKWGAGWLKNPLGINKAVQLVQAHRADVASLIHKMEQELNVFA